MAVGPMTDQEFQAWLQQHGGERGRSDETKPTKSKDAATGEEIAGEIVHTTVTAADGATIVLRRTAPYTNTGGAEGPTLPSTVPSYEIISQSTGPTKPKAASATPNKTANDEATAAEELRQKKANQAAGNGFNTDAVVKANTDKAAATAKADAARAAAAAKAANSGTTLTVEQPDGFVHILKPDGTSIKTTLKVKPKPSTTTTVKDANEDQYTVVTDGDGNTTVTPLNLPKKSAGPPTPASATGWNPDPSKVDGGFGARRKDIAGMLEAGTFGDPTLQSSVDKANVLLKQDYDHADMVSKNLGNIQKGEETVYRGRVDQRTADQNQSNVRLSQAVSVLDDAVKDISTNAYKVRGKDGGWTVVNALNAMLDKTRLLAEQFGGLVDSPTIEPGANMTRTSDLFKPLQPSTPAMAPVEAPAMAPVVQPDQPPAVDVTELPAMAPVQPFTPPPTGAPGGPGWPQQAPPAPQPTSITDRAQQARQLFGAEPPPLADPVGRPSIAAASASPLIQNVQAQQPTSGGTLAWAQNLGFAPEILQQWMAMRGQQPAA